MQKRVLSSVVSPAGVAGISPAAWYGVFRGRQTGVFKSWRETERSVKGVSGAKFKKFPTREEAEYYAKTGCFQENEKRQTAELQLPAKESIEGIHIFTDGSFSGGTKRSGIGVAFSEPLKHLAVARRLANGTTNQEAELRALLEALLIVDRERLTGIGSPVTRITGNGITVWTDSDYSLKCLREWAPRWKRNGWRTTNDEPVKHREIIQELDDVWSRLKEERITLRHIKEVGLTSHQSRDSVRNGTALQQYVWEGNSRADALAKGL
jgi:ribonuclease HI